MFVDWKEMNKCKCPVYDVTFVSNQYTADDKLAKMIRTSAHLNWKQDDNNLTVEVGVPFLYEYPSWLSLPSKISQQEPLLLTSIGFNPNMDE